MWDDLKIRDGSSLLEFQRSGLVIQEVLGPSTWIATTHVDKGVHLLEVLLLVFPLLLVYPVVTQNQVGMDLIHQTLTCDIY